MIGFVWKAAKGYRLRPWASPYVKWRIETYSGMPAESITPAVFFRFAWRERSNLQRFLAWQERLAAGR